MPASITLSIDPPTLDVQAGAEASAQLKVQNRSQFVGQYTLSVSGAEAAWATLEPDQLGVFPGGDATATLRVRRKSTRKRSTPPISSPRSAGSG